MTASPPVAESRLAQYLPALYRQDGILNGLLCAFEKVLFGRQGGVEDHDKGLEEKIASVAACFDPANAHADFLPWLAKWLAVSLRADLEEQQVRKLLASSVDFYHRRGTRRNLENLLSFFTLGQPEIIDGGEGLQIGKHSTIGKDTFVGDGVCQSSCPASSCCVSYFEGAGVALRV